MEGIAIVVADFDGVTYHLSNPDEKTKTKILVSIGMGFFRDLVPHGVMDVRCERVWAYLRFVRYTQATKLSLRR
jgi:hypothetical protein